MIAALLAWPTVQMSSKGRARLVRLTLMTRHIFRHMLNRLQFLSHLDPGMIRSLLLLMVSPLDAEGIPDLFLSDSFTLL